MNGTPIHDKVIASTGGAALSQILVWGFEVSAKVDVPAGVEIAFATLLTLALGFFVPESKPATTGPNAPDERGYGLVEVALFLLILAVAVAILANTNVFR